MSNNEDKLAAGKREKDNGNECFKKGDVKEALRYYHQALLNLSGLQNNKSFAVFRKEQEEEPKKDPLQEDILKTTSVVYSNMSACCIKLENWTKALNYANMALKNDPENTKALFRRAQAYINEGNTTRAREDLEKLTEKNPEDAAIKREWYNLKKKDREQDEKQRKELKGMFDRGRKKEENEENKDNKSTNTTTAHSQPASTEPRFVELDD
ncbi:3526_t:CDS:2 [Funneliformis geosporum]|uniref:13357_t:CDS:1 n=1 Tax=Funneliformis geosporum TaxID=1117311 RepID=A0A9W4SAY1_9GLOM|nr:13357_t:CDS:2 [Funneliformis geosporum]CAI2163389.1 3526_t:CDS:2 [Funneliformis geosporum]